MELEDFVFFHQGKIVKSLSSAEAPLLAAIDKVVSEHHEHAILLLHGFSSSPAVYRALIPRLTSYDRILCPILPGHAQSIQAFSQATAQQWQDTARAACEQLVRDYAKVSVVGFSMGGVLALELSQEFHLEHLYLLAPALKLRGLIAVTNFAARALRLLGCKTIANLGGNLCSNQFQELTYRRLPLNAVIEILALIQAHPLIQPNCPTDLFLGRHDKVVDSPRIAKQYANHPLVQIHWLDQSAHILPLDTDREIIFQAIN